MATPAFPISSEVEDVAWYVLHTQSRHEAKVESSLETWGLQVFLPRVTVRSRRRDRFQLIEVPLFPGYLFVHANLNSWAYDHIIRHRSVFRILGNKGRYTPVSDDIVASIRSILESGKLFYPWCRLVPGRRVRVIAGPLAGAIGTIWRSKPGKRRLVVGVDLLGRSVAVDLEEDCVEPYF